MGAGSSRRKVEVSPYLIQCFTDAHEGGVNCMTVSRDSSMIATGGEDFVAKVWHVSKPDSEALKCICRGHTSYITTLRIFDEFLVTASNDKTLKKWDIENDGEFILEYSGHGAIVNDFILTDDYLLSSSYDKTVRWWQFVTGECLKVFEGHKRSVGPLLFIPAKSSQDEDGPDMNDTQDDDMFVSGSSDGTARLWSLESARCVRTFAGHENAVLCLEIEGGHEVLFTGSLDCTIRSWVLETGEPLKVFSGHEAPVLQIKVLNKLLFSASSDHCAKSWITEFGDCTRTYKGHKHSVLSFTLHEGIIYTGSGDGLVRAFDVKSGSQKRMFGGHAESVNSIAILPNGRIFTGSNDGCLIIWDSIGIKSDQQLREERKNKVQSSNNQNKDELQPDSSKDSSQLNESVNSRTSLNSSRGGGARGKTTPEVAIDIDNRPPPNQHRNKNNSKPQDPMPNQVRQRTPPEQQQQQSQQKRKQQDDLDPGEQQRQKQPSVASSRPKSIPMDDLDDEFD